MQNWYAAALFLSQLSLPIPSLQPPSSTLPPHLTKTYPQFSTPLLALRTTTLSIQGAL